MEEQVQENNNICGWYTTIRNRCHRWWIHCPIIEIKWTIDTPWQMCIDATTNADRITRQDKEINELWWTKEQQNSNIDHKGISQKQSSTIRRKIWKGQEYKNKKWIEKECQDINRKTYQNEILIHLRHRKEHGKRMEKIQRGYGRWERKRKIPWKERINEWHKQRQIPDNEEDRDLLSNKEKTLPIQGNQMARTTSELWNSGEYIHNRKDIRLTKCILQQLHNEPQTR